MECTVNWGGPGGMAFTAQTGTGHTIVMDGAASAGGHDTGARPMELLLAGAAGCSGFDVVQILTRGRHAITGCHVHVDGTRAETDPKVYTKIHLHYTLTGDALPAGAVERAIALSKEKYCSATIMLAKTAEVTTSYAIESATR